MEASPLESSSMESSSMEAFTHYAEVRRAVEPLAAKVRITDSCTLWPMKGLAAKAM